MRIQGTRSVGFSRSRDPSLVPWVIAALFIFGLIFLTR